MFRKLLNYLRVSSTKEIWRNKSLYSKEHEKPLTQTVRHLPKSEYGGRQRVTMIPGRGVGRELMEQVIKVFDFIGAPVDFEIVNVSDKLEGFEDVDMQKIITSLKHTRAGIMGYIGLSHKKDPFQMNPPRSTKVRLALDIYVNIIEVVSFKQSEFSKFKDINMIVVRQNNYGEYAFLEHSPVPGVVENLKIFKKYNSEVVVRYAFEYARTHGRKKITTIHKANIMKLADGSFLRLAQEISREYPEIEHTDMIVDNATMQLVSDPHQFDVVLTSPLYGSIISNIVAGLTGGPSLLAAGNYGPNIALFEPGTRTPLTRIERKNAVNPTGMLKASALLLKYLGHERHAEIIEQSIKSVINDKCIRTAEMGGCHRTTDYMDELMNSLYGCVTASFHGDSPGEEPPKTTEKLDGKPIPH